MEKRYHDAFVLLYERTKAIETWFNADGGNDGAEAATALRDTEDLQRSISEAAEGLEEAARLAARSAAARRSYARAMDLSPPPASKKPE